MNKYDATIFVFMSCTHNAQRPSDNPDTLIPTGLEYHIPKDSKDRRGEIVKGWLAT
ncbi:MAG: hypothetical protein ABJB16_10955 [Saprospiraceae bacterium]